MHSGHLLHCKSVDIEIPLTKLFVGEDSLHRSIQTINLRGLASSLPCRHALRHTAGGEGAIRPHSHLELWHDIFLGYLKGSSGILEDPLPAIWETFPASSAIVLLVTQKRLQASRHSLLHLLRSSCHRCRKEVGTASDQLSAYLKNLRAGIRRTEWRWTLEYWVEALLNHPFPLCLQPCNRCLARPQLLARVAKPLQEEQRTSNLLLHGRIFHNSCIGACRMGIAIWCAGT